MTEPTNNIDELMSMDPLQMSAVDIDAIIAYHRRNRANAEAGVKPKKETGPSPKIDVAALGLSPVVTAEPIKRRF